MSKQELDSVFQYTCLVHIACTMGIDAHALEMSSPEATHDVFNVDDYSSEYKPSHRRCLITKPKRLDKCNRIQMLRPKPYQARQFKNQFT